MNAPTPARIRRRPAAVGQPLRTPARLALALALLLVGAVPARACRCVEPLAPAAAYAAADLVVRATVLHVEPGAGDGEATARIELAQAWKRPVPAHLEVSTRSTCAYPFEAGQAYLLYLRASGPGAYATRRCAGNLPAAEAGRALDWLRRHGRETAIERGP